MRLLRTLLAAACTLSGQAYAAGPYDGIYNIPNTPMYMSVHQNGTRLIAAVFTTIPASNVFYSLGDGQVMPLYRSDYWDLMSGDLFGNRSTIVGQVAFGACESTWQAVFTTSSLAVTRVSIRNTPQGSAAGVSCAAFQNWEVERSGLTSYWTKVF